MQRDKLEQHLKASDYPRPGTGNIWQEFLDHYFRYVDTTDPDLVADVSVGPPGSYRHTRHRDERALSSGLAGASLRLIEILDDLSVLPSVIWKAVHECLVDAVGTDIEDDPLYPIAIARLESLGDL